MSVDRIAIYRQMLREARDAGNWQAYDRVAATIRRLAWSHSVFRQPILSLDKPTESLR